MATPTLSDLSSESEGEESSQSSMTEDEVELQSSLMTTASNTIEELTENTPNDTSNSDGSCCSGSGSDQKEAFHDEVHESVQHPLVRDKSTFNLHSEEPLSHDRSKKERFMLKFIDKVKSILESTLVGGKKRDDILKELFSNIATEIEDPVRAYLHSDDASAASDNSHLPKYYYELLAERYCTHPEDIQTLQTLFMALWGNSNFPIIYSALVYKWIFKHGHERVRNFNIFIKGLNRLFWFDLETVSSRFSVIYKYIMNEVVLNEEVWDPALRRSDGVGSVVDRFQSDFFNLVARFYIYYENHDTIAAFLAKMQAIFDKYGMETFHSNAKTAVVDAASRITGISAADIFVQCVIRQIKLVKNEYVLLRYIKNCVEFQGLNLSDETRVKLQATLYTYTSPGGPAYAPRSVRTAARATIDTLFPSGRFSRKTIHYLFRLLHPYYSTRSIVHWVFSFFKPVLSFFGPSLEEEEEEEALRRINQRTN